MLALSLAPSNISEGAMHMVGSFVILVYDRTSTSTEIDKARRKLFAKKADIKQIPPTKAPLEQHVMRAVFQGGHIWGQALLASPVLPLPTSWGWTKTEDGLYEPVWTTLPEAAQACYELISCKCKKLNLSVQLFLYVRESVHRSDLQYL